MNIKYLYFSKDCLFFILNKLKHEITHNIYNTRDNNSFQLKFAFTKNSKCNVTKYSTHSFIQLGHAQLRFLKSVGLLHRRKSPVKQVIITFN